MAKELKREGLSEEKKGLILALLAEGHSERRVASILNISKTAVHKNKIKQQTLGTTKPQTGRGRKRLSVDQDDRQLIRMSLNNRRMTSSDLQKEWEMTAGIKCTARTVRNRLLGAGLKSCKARKKPFINEKERARPSMGDVPVNAISLDLLRDARETVRTSPLGVINTPMIPWCQTTLPLNIPCNIHIKLENMQRTGSFKIRGVANQFARRPKGGNFVTMSAGNYGKSFAYATKHYGSKGKVVMPETAPESRSTLIQSFGCEVERVPTSCLINVVNRCVEENDMTFLHSYDDLDLIAGHASLGFEILELMPQPDVVVVCCGGGGLLAGVAAAIKLSGCVKTRIYGVEPEGACTMYKSLIEKKPVGMDSESIASGLAPPTAGTLPYELCQSYVEEIVLVSDEEIKSAVSTLYRAGLLVEPSGCAAFAAIANNRIPDIAGRNVVVILSGGNIGKDELTNFAD